MPETFRDNEVRKIPKIQIFVILVKPKIQLNFLITLSLKNCLCVSNHQKNGSKIAQSRSQKSLNISKCLGILLL
jgi:hypothetical protein